MLGELQQFAEEYFEVNSSQVAPGRFVIAVSSVSLCQWRLKVNDRLQVVCSKVVAPELQLSLEVQLIKLVDFKESFLYFSVG